MGRAYSALKDTSRALTNFSKAISITPTNRDAYIDRARIYYGQRNWEAAKNDLEKAIRLVGTDGAAWLMHGACLMNLGQRDPAKVSFEKSKELGHPHAEKYLNYYFR